MNKLSEGQKEFCNWLRHEIDRQYDLVDMNDVPDWEVKKYYRYRSILKWYAPEQLFLLMDTDKDGAGLKSIPPARYG